MGIEPGTSRSHRPVTVLRFRRAPLRSPLLLVALASAPLPALQQQISLRSPAGPPGGVRTTAGCQVTHHCLLPSTYITATCGQDKSPSDSRSYRRRATCKSLSESPSILPLGYRYLFLALKILTNVLIRCRSATTFLMLHSSDVLVPTS